VRRPLLIAASLAVLLAACGSDDGSGTRPSIAATIPSDASIVRPTVPEIVAGTSPAEPESPETQPEAPPAEPEAPDAAPSSAVAVVDGDADSDTVWWPWVLGAVVLLAIGALVARSRRRPSEPPWQARTTTLLDDVDELTSHLAALTPDGVRAVAHLDAATLATTRARLSELVASAPDVARRTALDRLTGPTAELHGAVDAVALSAGGTVQPGGASVAQLAAQLHTASASARADLAVHR
jgi:hypothetical protein